MGVAEEGRRRGGFTLIEVVIVLVLAGLALGLAVPFVGGGLDALRAEAAGRGVVSFLNAARIEAMNTRSPVEVSYDFEERIFKRVLLTQKGGERARYRLPNGVRVTRIERAREFDEKGTASILFYPMGDSGGGTIHMTGAGGRGYRITVGVLFASPKLARENAAN